MTPETLKMWRTETMGLTQPQAAAALGVAPVTYQEWERGERFATGKPVKIDLRTALACAALAHGLKPL
jgi:DNA-binding XRE family transcriptional regulator